MPAEYVPWFRMKVDDLPPREYWATAQEDIELATMLQDARHRGEWRADREAKQAAEKQRKASERERKADESIRRLQGRS